MQIPSQSSLPLGAVSLSLSLSLIRSGDVRELWVRARDADVDETGKRPARTRGGHGPSPGSTSTNATVG